MSTTEGKHNIEGTHATPHKKAEASRTARQDYRRPVLHDIGKARQLVQGGGGSYADNNRARQY